MAVHIARYFQLAAAVSFVMGCSDGSNDAQVSNDDASQPDTIASRLITGVDADLREAWICVDQVGEPAAYTFYDKGVADAPDDVYFGVELSIRENVPPFYYVWVPLDNSSVALQSPPQGVQDVWTNVEFSSDNPEKKLMRAISGARGQLFCSLEGEQQ